jgi:hypothetical protein
VRLKTLAGIDMSESLATLLLELQAQEGDSVNRKQGSNIGDKVEFAYGKYHDNVFFAFNHDRKVKSDLQTFEGFINEDILDSSRRDEPGRRGRKICRRRTSRLDPQPSENKQRLFCI